VKLVDDARDWSKWWSVRLSITGTFILTLLEVFPDVISTIVVALPEEVRQALEPNHLKIIGIICIAASPVARVLKQSRLDDAGRSTD
jgi:hypothetical protein